MTRHSRTPEHVTPSSGSRDGDEARARVSSREALRFLTRAGRVLSRSLDPDRTLERIVRLAVPRVACFAAIDLGRDDDDRVQRVGFAHVDPSRQPLLERPEPFYPAREGLLPIAEVLESGEALMIEDLEAGWPRDTPEQRQVLERLRRLDARSLIAVPLGAREATRGVLTLGSTRTDRFYGRSDLTLAQELARSANLALENARLYRDARRAIRARDEVLSVVSHDLRNPVGRVRMAAELLLEAEHVPDEARTPLDVILRAADEMNRLIGDLLDVARIEEGRLSVDPRHVPLPRFLADIEAAHAGPAREYGVDWRVEPPAGAEDAGTTSVHADEDRVLQALGNLIGNAMKFTPEGGAVRLVTRVETDDIVFGIIDDGPGISTEQLAHIFDRFWQARAGDRRGAGLGLAIARGIAEAHGGRLWLDSEPHRGTRAWLALPRG